MSEQEPTKACIRVLKFENKVKYVLLYPFVKFLQYFSRFIDWLVQFINWCIVRAVVRWVGLPVIVGIGYEMWIALTIKPTYINGAYDQTPFAIIFMCCVALVVVGGVVLSCWVEVPQKEKEILTEYLKWF
jgi:hypothetical protein